MRLHHRTRRTGRKYQCLPKRSQQSKYASHPSERVSLRLNNFIERAIEAPVIRQLFSSSPRDPRYHMLSYISHKFSQEIPTHANEPRAALFLNRFSRTLTIMYATNGLADVLGVTADQLLNKSFYFCIQENCLREAVKCLESAKANDSIAYLRFWFRDPTQENRQNSNRQDEDDPMMDGNSSGDDDEGGVHLSELMDHDGNETANASDSSNSMRSSAEPHYGKPLDPNSRSSSGNSTDRDGSVQDPIFDQPAGGQSRTSSVSTPDDARSSNQSWSPEQPQIELEAVVSCTSDGLVVVLRRAKPFVPHITTPVAEPPKHQYANGFFASPWANDPILPNFPNRANPLPDQVRPAQFPIRPTAAQANTAAIRGPDSEDFMNSIREVAVFAWSLTGINGSLEKYGRGTPSGESLPPDGYPVWDPSSSAGPERQTLTKHITNGYNYSPSTGLPTTRQIQAHDSLVNGYHQTRIQDHPYTTSAPANGFYEPSQRSDHGYRDTRQYNAMDMNGHGNTSFGNGYGVQSQDFGNVKQAQSASGGWQNQNGAHHSVAKREYDPYAVNQYEEPQMVYDEGQSSSVQNRTQTNEYDPYASTTYQGPASANNSWSQEPHPEDQWTFTDGAQPQMDGHGY